MGNIIFGIVRHRMAATVWNSTLAPSIDFFLALGQVIVITAGSYMVSQGNLTSGDVVAFLLYIGLFFGPIATLAFTFDSIQRAVIGAIRTFELLDQPLTIEDGTTVANSISGEIEFDNVLFSYENSAVILDHLSLRVPAGQTVALIGTTGAGKTTFLNLIIRMFDPQEGRICIDSVDIREYTLDSLRENISIVSQDVFLFSGTIYDNIIYSKPDATREEVHAAAQNSAIHDFIVSLKDGYDTIIGEKGVKLSGGQRQRVAIARALLRDAPILLLDEATSAVDEETEREIRRAVISHAKGKTVLIVTHRLASIADADRVITIEEGRVVEDIVK